MRQRLDVIPVWQQTSNLRRSIQFHKVHFIQEYTLHTGIGTCPRAIHSMHDLLVKCRYYLFSSDNDRPTGASLFRSLSQVSAFTGCLWLKVLVFLKKTEQLLHANRQFASQVFIFRVHETETSTFPLRYVMSAMTFDSSLFPAFSSTEAVLPLVCINRNAASAGGMRSRSRNFLCTAHARRRG